MSFWEIKPGVILGLLILMVAVLFLSDSLIGTDFVGDWPGTYLGKFFMGWGIGLFGYAWYEEWITFTKVFNKIKEKFLRWKSESKAL